MVKEGPTSSSKLALRDANGWRTATLSADEDSVSITRLDGTILELRRAEGTWTLREGEHIHWTLPSDGLVLPVTGTPLDIPIFARLLGPASKPSTALHVWVCDLSSACSEEPVAAFLEDRGFEKIDAVFTGTRHLDLSIRDAGSVGIWIGEGPFYGGQPVRLQSVPGKNWERLR